MRGGGYYENKGDFHFQRRSYSSFVPDSLRIFPYLVISIRIRMSSWDDGVVLIYRYLDVNVDQNL